MKARIAATRRGLRVASTLLFAALACQGVMLRPALAWWNGDWNYRVKIDADASPKGANIADPIGRTQVLLRLHSGNFNFQTVKEDGSDIRFVAADDRTPLHYHIEKFDGLVDQVALIWVDVPDLAPGAVSSFYMYWGNDKVADGGDPKGTYDPDQLLVYHFGDSNGLPRDTTGYGNNALTAGKRDEGGMIGYGLRLDGTAPIRMPQSPTLAITAGQPLTWSMWVRPKDVTASAVLFDQRDAQNALTIGLDAGVPYAQITTPAATQRTTRGAALTGDAWHLITVTASNHLTVYVDGVKSGDVLASLPAIGGTAMLGGSLAQPVAATAPATPVTAATPAVAAPAAPSAAPAASVAPAAGAAPAVTPVAPPPNYVGLIDELRISKALRQSGAIQVELRSEGPQANLLALETPEQSSSLGNGYIGIILKSVTPDAWVVIGVLVVMMAISWIVMVSKATYIGATAKANRAFRAAFRKSSAEALESGKLLQPITADGQPQIRRSPLFRLYGIATTELHERLHGGRLRADGLLAPQSLSAIRSALDAGLVQEQQKLSKMMVLLTIAIAGGPFIGLLGTVVGVMITFASIAAAGDVNVNAIAPGISAALFATVTGLFVAIPALFGYNYFNVRIKDVTSEMHVFVDELVTRLAEDNATRAMQAGE